MLQGAGRGDLVWLMAISQPLRWHQARRRHTFERGHLRAMRAASCSGWDSRPVAACPGPGLALKHVGHY